MSSFRTSVTPQRRSAARFVENVRRKLVAAYSEQPEVTQTAIAEALGVHRSVISRQLRGASDMSIGRVAELAWCLGKEPTFDLIARDEGGGNHPVESSAMKTIVRTTSGEKKVVERKLETSQ